MFLFFSKLTGLFINPSYWFALLFAWWFFAKSPIVKKRLAITLALFIFILGNEVLQNKIVNAWQPRPVQLTGHYEAGILLGGIAGFDIYGNGFLNSATDRLLSTCILYKTGVIKKIIISAGNIQKNRPNEALFISKKMIEMGIPAQDIIVEGKSRTTYENALYSKKKIDSMQLKPPYVVITSATHVPRALRVFEKAGLQVVAYPCNYMVIEKKFEWNDYLIPKLYVINDWNVILKEFIGLAGYKLFGKA